jgi:sulfite exporter TauE/SafE
MQIKFAQQRRAVACGMADPIAALFHICTPLHQDSLLVGTNLAAMALLGAAGSVVHCGPMCGPLVLGQVTSRLSCLPCQKMSEMRRLQSGLLANYHVGRITTYAVLGALAGTAGLGIADTLRPLRGLVLLAAAAALLVAAWRQFTANRTGTVVTNSLQRRLLKRVRPGSLAYGLALGLLPCGLLYTALLAAAATASPLWGTAAMIAFGAGTVPMLAAIGVAGNSFAVRPWLLRAAPALFVVNAAFLVVGSVTAMR